MMYKINKRPSNQFVIMMDYDCQRAAELCDALDADEALDCYQFIGRKKLAMHEVYLRITGEDLRKADGSEQTAYIDRICKTVIN